ncbi:Epi-isozizaene 5-monooxygenase/(E)-beta-farnesene synthase [Enhygromyxa salina]|uniref:Epi-isozizaene 5-monooxygenase/(E)-beta-farnesene synthase n=2 Tax=Enhygromyxa salina TaxID=215803 RepID=A0A2S9YUW6_9BACT|nr:Epi-isozizaene 5-monooxygenase/(E)-beta-farnesene synthase [Enhygromyxa salina]
MISLGLIPFVDQAWRQLGDCFEFGVAGETIKVVVHPDDAESLLLRRRDKYAKGGSYDQFRRHVGTGLIGAEGQAWRTERRIIQPSFTRSTIAKLSDQMVAQTDRMLERWAQTVPPGEAFDVHPELMRLTLEIIAESLFELTFDGQEGALDMQAISDAVELISQRVTAVAEFPSWVPTPGNRRLERAVAGLNRVVRQIIDHRRASGEDRDDLLGALLRGRDDNGAALEYEQLRDEVVTMVVAGHETTAVALGWTLWLLSQHPDLRARMIEEIDGALGGRAPTSADLAKLGYVKQVARESMRLIPPTWAVARNCVTADTLGPGHPVEPGVRVMHMIWLTHRHPEFWPDPERFDPDRFEPEVFAKQHKFAYTPFSEGPRKCIGEHFSTVELMLVLTRLFQRFDLEAAPGFTPEIDYQLTTRPRTGIMMRRRER